MDRSLPGSSVHGFLQARKLEWVAISFSHRRIYKGKNMLTLGCLTEKKERLQNNTQSVTQRLWETHFHRKNLCKHVLVAQSCSAVCNPMACSLPVSSVYEIFQARILHWVAIPFSRESSWPRDQTWVSCISDRFFIVWATREVPEKRPRRINTKNLQGLSSQ